MTPTPDYGTSPPFESGEPQGPSLGFILGVIVGIPIANMGADVLVRYAGEVFAVLFGGMSAFWRLTRSSELVVARAHQNIVVVVE